MSSDRSQARPDQSEQTSRVVGRDFRARRYVMWPCTHRHHLQGAGRRARGSWNSDPPRPRPVGERRRRRNFRPPIIGRPGPLRRFRQRRTYIRASSSVLATLYTYVQIKAHDARTAWEGKRNGLNGVPTCNTRRFSPWRWNHPALYSDACVIACKLQFVAELDTVHDDQRKGKANAIQFPCLGRRVAKQRMLLKIL
jgi:hypothetical protein